MLNGPDVRIHENNTLPGNLWQGATARNAAALAVLLNNNEESLGPPLPLMTFSAGANKDDLYYEGPVSAPQYDRLQYLSKKAGIEVKALPARDHAETHAHQIQLHGGDTQTLELLAADEPLRRARAHEAELLMRRATGLDWCWDGFCLTTPRPQENHPVHKVLESFPRKGVTQSPYDLSVFHGKTGAGATEWLSVHNCDLVRLRIIGQELQASQASHSR